MAETIASTDRTESGEGVRELYDHATEMAFSGPEADADQTEASANASDADKEAASRTRSGETAYHVIRSSAASQKAEISQMGEISILRIEQLRAENVELKAETHRLRQELTSLRERNTALERTNFHLDEKVSELNAAEKRVGELQHTIEYYGAARKSLVQDVRRLQDSLSQSEKRFGHTEAQLRAICQERSDRITVMSEELRALQRGKAELEQQVESLLGYRQRAMSCLQQLTEELKRLRKENREKSRRLSEARAILRNIDQRLAESISEPN
ncbi:MAG: hypothetical protein JXQ73_31550 [Phycisphaerae bacterium]|nr:hypothetical protein [Phycisphaerae bacterium]